MYESVIENIAWRKIVESHSYFSVWAFYLMIMVILSETKNTDFHTKCLFFSIISCCGGSYLSVIHPKKLNVDYLNYEFRGKTLIMMDFIGHYVPLILYFIYYYIPSKTSVFELIYLHGPIPILYAVSDFPMRLYGFRKTDLYIISTVSIAMTMIVSFIAS